MCRGQSPYPDFAPHSSEAAVGFDLFFFFNLVVHNLPQLHLCALISLLEFFPVLLLEERFVQVQVLQPSISGPSPPQKKKVIISVKLGMKALEVLK